MKIKGIKQGQTIKLEENLSIPDDSQVVIEIEVTETNANANLQKMKEFLATPWDGKTDFCEAMAEIDRERHTYLGRNNSYLNE